MMTNEVTINLNVLRALMKNIIISNVNITTAIIVNKSTCDLRSTHVS